jgi:hypothetical protein
MYLRYYSDTPTSYQDYLAMRNIADVSDGKRIAIRSQSIRGMSAVNPLIAFYDINDRKGEVLFFFSVPATSRDYLLNLFIIC